MTGLARKTKSKASGASKRYKVTSLSTFGRKTVLPKADNTIKYKTERGIRMTFVSLRDRF
jgi:hypothetical protein